MPVATFGVSWLKIKPVVLIFPVTESTIVDSVTHTTVKILWGEDSLLYSVFIYFRFLTSILMIEAKVVDSSKPLSGFVDKSTVQSLLYFLHKKGIKALLLLCFYTFFLYKLYNIRVTT